MKYLPETDTVQGNDPRNSQKSRHGKVHHIDPHRHKNTKSRKDNICQPDDDHPQYSPEEPVQHAAALLKNKTSDKKAGAYDNNRH